MIVSRSEIVEFQASDGVRLAGRLYRPAGEEPRPVLFAASPYRFDNDDIPETCTYLWRETGPIDWYVEQGYAYFHMDVRGSGRSGGDYGFFDRRERRDLYEAIEWIAEQPWCNGKVGGIGHSYYAQSQWAMASERPPHLACIAPYDGLCDLYRGWAYQGGVPSHFTTEWWCGNVRPINLHPLTPQAPARDMPRDLVRDVSFHPLHDEFWEERSFHEALEGCTIPLFSIGVWTKLDLHLRGNIEGFQRFAGPKRLMLSAAPHMSAAQAEFESVAFHERYLLPFYDRYLKGAEPPTTDEPAVVMSVRASDRVVTAGSWPLPPKDMTLFLSANKSDAVRSLNGGSLVRDFSSDIGETSLTYPDRDWSLGNVELTPTGPNPTSRNLTFTTEALDDDVWLCGEPVLTVFVSSTRDDTDVIVKLVEQFPAGAGGPPRSLTVSKGWLRASHRELLPSEYGVRHRHDTASPIEPGRVYELTIALVASAYRFSKGSRIRLDVSCADSPVTDTVFWHYFTPDKVGTDTIYHDEDHRSRIVFPLLAEAPPPS